MIPDPIVLVFQQGIHCVYGHVKRADSVKDPGKNPKSKNTALLKSSFVSIRLFSAADWRMTPTLPQGGKQSKGSIPLTPSFFGIYFNLVRSYRNRGDARAAGAEA
jgi:hypothetical protein